MCAERELVFGITYFTENELWKYEWIGAITEDKSLFEYVPIGSLKKGW